MTNAANQPIGFRSRDDVRRQRYAEAHRGVLGTLAPEPDPRDVLFGVAAHRSREIVLAADIRATDRLVDDLVSKIEAALEGRLSDDDLSSITARLQDTAELTPDQILRLRIPMMKFEGLLLGVRAMRGPGPAPTPS